MENYSSASLTLKNPTSDQKLHYILAPQQTTLLGRSPDCQIVLNPSEYPTVSRYHAQIELIENNHQILWQIVDKGTTNGTLINSKKIDHPHALQTGDTITLGFKGPEFLFITEALEATVLMDIPEDKQVDLTTENSEETSSSKVNESVEKETENQPTPVAEENESESVKEAEKETENQPTPVAEENEPEKEEESTSDDNQPSESIEETENKPTPVAEKDVSASEESKSEKVTDDSEKLTTKAEDENKDIAYKNKEEVKSKTKRNQRRESKKTDNKVTEEEAENKPQIDLSSIAIPELTNTKKVWDIIQIKEVATLDIDSQNIECLALNSQNQVLAIALKDKSIQLWDWQNKKEIVTINKAHRMSINSLTFSDDSKTLISSGSDKTIKLWQIENQTEIASLSGHKQAINTLAISNDGKIVASSGSDKTIKIWDVEKQTEINSFSGHKLAVNSVCLSQDNKYVLSGGGDKTIKIWNLETAEEEKTIKTDSKSAIEYLSLSNDGKLILSIFQDNHLSIIDRTQDVAIFDFNFPEKIGELTTVNKTGNLFVSTLKEGGVMIWQI